MTVRPGLSGPARVIFYIPCLVMSILAPRRDLAVRMLALSRVLILIGLIGGGVMAYRVASASSTPVGSETVVSEVDSTFAAGGAGADGSRVRMTTVSGLMRTREPRRDAPEPAEATKVIDLQSVLELRGILGGDAPRAVVAHTATGIVHTLEVGDRIEEFEVIRVEPTSITLRFQDQELELAL